MLDLKIIIGSTRPGRAADRVIPWITSAAREHGGFGVDVIDLRDWELPIFGETFATVRDPRNPAFFVPAVKHRNQKIAEGGAYLFITPEYNHSVPAMLKNAIDSVFATFAFRTKPSAGEARPLVRAAFSPLERASFTMLGIRQFMRLHIVPAGPLTGMQPQPREDMPR